ncbi:HAMP domain-containing sensor histidine kinase [Paenibacillus sp. LHD-117]|uniref:sensor histidine kinase n=1 Tax=Paenibacillus sp. LHD-117 TaxID=3071412 RepID=UPI0027DEC0E0|nr:HAMP domain-containing sensor histidine kinase [Paenibacillus sp. LHD-117]MDQ6419473.1 HAMP domain-containing sensor histidine kinase [Paenibacillus sp. LHD-117]
MKTLYVRIVAIFIGITVFSVAAALLGANYYYAKRLQHHNETKVLPIAEQVKAVYEASPGMVLDEYLTRISKMGFQVYLAKDEKNGVSFGDPFKDSRLDPSIVRNVIDGEAYFGLPEQSRLLKIMAFFENSLRNTAGLPLDANGETYAFFIKPNLEQQIGDVRVLLALLLGYAFLISLALIVILTRTIVKPLKALEAATERIAGGNYRMELNMSRNDEIGDLARHFSRMAQSLERLDEMRQQFVANVSHEFQTPVTSIQGFTQAILNGETSPEEEREYLSIIHEESKRLSSLSKGLLTLAALDRETGLPKRDKFRLDEQLRQVLIVTEWQWSQKSLDIELDLPEVTVSGDEGLMYQVWMNLISNSIKFCRPGDRIVLDIADGREGIVVTVTDTGIGIPASDLPYLFDRFYKADKARNRAVAGSGLGLSIARRIIELHEGRIDVTSVPGSGTSFSVTLPYL